jgi:hypothetical protein
MAGVFRWFQHFIDWLKWIEMDRHAGFSMCLNYIQTGQNVLKLLLFWVKSRICFFNGSIPHHLTGVSSAMSATSAVCAVPNVTPVAPEAARQVAKRGQ